MHKKQLNEIWGVFFLLLGLFTLASLVFFKQADIPFYTSHPHTPIQNYTGVIGAYVAFALLVTFGMASYFIPFLFLLWASCYFMQKVPEKKIFKTLGLAIALISSATIIAISVSTESRFDQAGAIGYIAGSHLLKYFGQLGSYILATACLMLSLLLATDFLLYPIVKKMFGKTHGALHSVIEQLLELRSFFAMIFERISAVKEKMTAKSALKAEEKKVSKKYAQNDLPEIKPKIKTYRPDIADEKVDEKAEALKASVAQTSAPEPAPVKKKIPLKKIFQKSVAEDEEGTVHDGVIGADAGEAIEYELPPIDLLNRPAPSNVKGGDDLQANSNLIEETLSRFNIKVKVTEIEQGPVITRYEVLPAPGVKVNSIASLQDDLALALKARSIRLIIPIPGKSAVGIEVPNSIKTTVSLREMIDSPTFKAKKCALPLVLGKDTSGKDMIADLATMPHMLIAGATGSGKSVCVNSIVTGLLYYSKPDDLKFVMIDPKMVELNVFNRIPHMLSPVVTDVKKAAATLNWVVNEMENRYKLLATVGVRNIESFNNRPMSEEALAEVEGKEDSENVIPARLPYIVVIVDELADLMMQQADKVEGAIARLAQLARAVGIHLILATQRPSVDVITGVIKANFPARVAFKVSSKVDSRTVLDANGADKLLGRGDMLFMRPGDEKAIRGQAPFVSDEEINGLVDFWANQGDPDFHPEIQKAQEKKSGGAGGGAQEKDELFDEAVQVILETGQASTSNLQRRLRLGYTRAARIIDQIEAEGLIGPAQGAKGREIYIGQEDTEPVESQVGD